MAGFAERAALVDCCDAGGDCCGDWSDAGGLGDADSPRCGCSGCCGRKDSPTRRGPKLHKARSELRRHWLGSAAGAND